MIKLSVTLTYSKIMAALILLLGFTFSIMLYKVNRIDGATQVFLTSMVTAGGLLGVRQVANVFKTNGNGNGLIGPQKEMANGHGLSEESSGVSVTDP